MKRRKSDWRMCRCGFALIPALQMSLDPLIKRDASKRSTHGMDTGHGLRPIPTS
jgi:hypothetical protein